MLFIKKATNCYLLLVILVLNFDVQDEVFTIRVATHPCYQIGTALLHPLLFGVEQFPHVHIHTQAPQQAAMSAAK